MYNVTFLHLFTHICSRTFVYAHLHQNFQKSMYISLNIRHFLACSNSLSCLQILSIPK